MPKISYATAWKIVNSIIIWIIVGALFWVLFLTLFDSSVIFGQNQLLIVGFIVLLLLFRYISKIKLGDFLEIEFLQKVEQTLDKAIATLDNTTTLLDASQITPNQLTNNLSTAKTDLVKVKADIETMKLYAHD